MIKLFHINFHCFIEEKIPIHFIVKLFIIPFYMGKSYTFL